MLEISDIARATYYFYINKKDIDIKNQDIIDKIKDIFYVHKRRYGYRRITLELKNQGLQVVGVSVDSDREKWQGALNKHQPAGIQISELKGWESVSRVDYGVQAIPFTVLIDASGKILARNPHGPLLEEIIEKYFSKK